MNKFFLDYFNFNGRLNLFFNIYSIVPSIQIKFYAYRKRISVKGFIMSAECAILRIYAGFSCSVYIVLYTPKIVKSDDLSI